MKVYEITIKPLSAFGTPLKGDTIFGHFCWQIAYDRTLLGKSLDELLTNYHSRPFAIFSSAYPRFCSETNSSFYAMKTPPLPLHQLFELPHEKREVIDKRKEYKAKQWMILKENGGFLSFKELDLLNDRELLKEMKAGLTPETRKQVRKGGASDYITQFSQSHNTINRLTGTTGEGPFAPFQVDQQRYFPETELAIFVGIDETVVKIEQVKNGLERIGEFGFGKDASTGLGRFELAEDDEIDLAALGSNPPNACYTLSPSVPEKDVFNEFFFTPFTRYGRHGDILARSSNPFKNPVIMADEGAVLIPKSMDAFSSPFIGTAVTNLSKAEPGTVAQGYSLYIPVSVEV